MEALLESNKIQTLEYLSALTMFVLCYGYTVSPNLYAIFACTFALLFNGTRNIWVFIIIELAAGCIPVTYHFLTDDYVLLNMLTYFPYPEEKNYYCMLAHVVLVWLIFMVLFAMQFIVGKKLGSQQTMMNVIQQLRRDEMR